MTSQTMAAAPRGRLLELTLEDWAVLGFGSVLAVAVIAGIRPDVTLWPATGLFFTSVVIGHLCMTARRYVAFPDLIAAAACLQWIIAPWLSTSYPPSFWLFRMALPADEYLRYAVPATFALWVGLHLPASRRLSTSWEAPETGHLSPYVKHTLDIAIVAGLLIDTYGGVVPSQFAFLVYLIASLRFAGALGWMVTRTPGWQLRAIVVLVHLTAMQSEGGLFYLVIHWGGYFLLVYAFMRRWRWAMAGALVASLLGIALLQAVKPTFRSSLVEQQVSGPVEAFTRLASMLWDRASEGRVIDPDADLGDSLVRFNQGWIIARIMKRVPADEPYAKGSTILDAAIFSIVPRFLVPSKKEGTSRELFTRFTGADLSSGTRMGMSIIGELYANFGLWGGVFTAFIYGCLMGAIFLFFADRARRNPLWWAAASTVLLPGVEPGFNLEDIANHVVKAAILFFLLWKTVRPLQALLALHEEDDDEGEADAAGDEVPSLDDAVSDR